MNVRKVTGSELPLFPQCLNSMVNHKFYYTSHFLQTHAWGVFVRTFITIFLIFAPAYLLLKEKDASCCPLNVINHLHQSRVNPFGIHLLLRFPLKCIFWATYASDVLCVAS